MKIFEHIIAYIAPHRCVSCKLEGDLICKNCIQRLIPPPQECFLCNTTNARETSICQSCATIYGLNEIRSAFAYNDVAKRLVHAAKFERARAGLYLIARLMPEPPCYVEVVTHIPTANSRVRQRGYDHAEQIARAYAKQHKLPFRTLLARTNNERQVGSSAKERKDHMQNAFRTVVKNPEQQHVLLIDDVITTGASMIVAASVLKKAGFKKVCGVTFARAPLTN